MKIGLTGGIASGKSTVSRMLKERGALIVDADQISREIVMPGSPVLQQIAEAFGSDILQGDGTLDRKRLGAIIFADDDKRRTLNAIMHPPIRAHMMQQMNEYETAYPQRLVVADIPLLYESNLQHMFEEVVVVYVPETVQIKRLMQRDGISEEHAKERIASQMPLSDKRERADVVIDNSRSLEDTEKQVDQYVMRKGLQ